MFIIGGKLLTRRVVLLFLGVFMIVGVSQLQAAAPPFYKVALDSAVSQTNRMCSSLGTNYSQLPRTYENNTLKRVGYGDWTSGFFPGCLWLLAKYTDGAIWKERARNWTNAISGAATVSDHDVGFRIFCSYGTGLPMQSAQQYASDTTIIMRAARTLKGRYNSTTKVIKSWDSFYKDGVNYTYPVIVDNMMNLELLCWASKNSTDNSFNSVAVSHANTTIKNHFRANYSSYHVLGYDPNNGNVLRKMTAQGYANESAWARGQAWGLYGYTVMYRETGDTTYLNQAKHIADFIIPKLPTDKVPYWDYDAPMSTNPPRDASAAAIGASALCELSTLTTGTESANYLATAKAILESLASSTYTVAPNTFGNFILKHSTGHKPANSEVDVPIIYADYYYLEALLRYRDIVEATGVIQPNNIIAAAPAGQFVVQAPDAMGRVHIQLPSKESNVTSIAFCDMQGKIQLKRSISGSKGSYDVTGLAKGCYMVFATTAQGTMVGSSKLMLNK